MDGEKQTYSIRGVEKKDLEFLRLLRNSQLNVLRHQRANSPEDQERYWDKYVSECATYRPPNYLYILSLDGESIGYGGLVNINWDLLEAEVSFLLHPSRMDFTTYRQDFTWYLNEICEMAKRPQWGLKALTGESYIIDKPLRPQAEHFGCLHRAGFKLVGSHFDNDRKVIVLYHRKEL